MGKRSLASNMPSGDHPKVRDLNEKVLEARGSENILLEAKAMAAKSRKGQFAPPLF